MLAKVVLAYVFGSWPIHNIVFASEELGNVLKKLLLAHMQL